MRFGITHTLILAGLLAACGTHSKRKDVMPPPALPNAPVDNSQKEREAQEAMERYRERAVIFAEENNIKIEQGLRELGCQVTVKKGITDCPVPENVEQADKQLDLIIGFRNAIMSDSNTLKDDVLDLSSMTLSALKASQLIDKSPIGKQVNDQFWDLRLKTYLNVNYYSSYLTFNYSTELKGYALVKELSLDPNFIALLGALPIREIRFDDKTHLDSDGKFFISPLAAKADVLRVLSLEKELAGAMSLTQAGALRAQLLLNRNLNVSSLLPAADVQSGLELLIELRKNEEFNRLTDAIRFESFALCPKTEIARMIFTKDFCIKATSSSTEILDYLRDY